MSWWNREPNDYWHQVLEGNQDYLDNRRDPRGFEDTANHLGTLHDGTAELIDVWDAQHPQYDYTGDGW